MKIIIENLTVEQAICINNLIMEENAGFVDACFERRIPAPCPDPEESEAIDDGFIIFMKNNAFSG